MKAAPQAAVGPKRAPINTPFKQQVLPAFQPVMSPPYVIGFFFLVAAVFIALGVAIVVTSDGIQRMEARYDDLQRCTWADRQFKPNFACDPVEVEFTVAKVIKAPVFLYYKLTNIFQNNRRFVLSVSYSQLSGGTASSTERTACAPFARPAKGAVVGTTVVNSSATAAVDMAGLLYLPCGLRAWSMFNDSFALYRQQETTAGTSWELVCDGSGFDVTGHPTNPGNAGKCAKRGISFDFEPGVRYVHNKEPSGDTLISAGWPAACEDASRRSPRSNASVFACNGWYLGEPGHALPTPADEDFINWMRPSSLSSFQRLYRRITQDLEPGIYKMRVAQRWDAASIDGTKSFVLMNTGWIGGPNMFLGVLFLVAGGISLIVAAAFSVKNHFNPPRLADLHA